MIRRLRLWGQMVDGYALSHSEVKNREGGGCEKPFYGHFQFLQTWQSQVHIQANRRCLSMVWDLKKEKNGL